MVTLTHRRKTMDVTVTLEETELAGTPMFYIMDAVIEDGEPAYLTYAEKKLILRRALAGEDETGLD